MDTKVKGIYPHTKGRFKVRKYNFHVGVYDTYEEAVKATIAYEEYYEIEKHWHRYEESKAWLIDKGLMSKD